MGDLHQVVVEDDHYRHPVEAVGAVEAVDAVEAVEAVVSSSLWEEGHHRLMEEEEE